MAYKRRKTSTVKIGKLHIGSNYPIVPQSMTTTDTMDTQKSVEQIIRMVNTGCELIRLTAPSMNEAQNLAEIKKSLDEKGINVPLVADIHFTPNAAELAAKIVEKVRVNPGNYADKKKFDTIDYTDEEYQEEIDRIREKFVPLIKICAAHGTALRIGTNHGSLSDRIMSRYGDTALGMVESAMEFLRIAEDENFHNIVLSMKSSNPQVMVQAYRLLVKTMDENNMHYPLHLGVTEAGDGDDGRIKSALGIGALLEDGIGDTVRVSLTEDPEFEVPVAKKLIERYNQIQQDNYPQIDLNNSTKTDWSAFEYKRRESNEVYNLGAHQVPRVIIDFSNHKNLQANELAAIGHIYDASIDKWHMNDLGSDFIFLGENKVPFMLPMGLKAIYHSSVWNLVSDKINAFPFFTIDEILQGKHQIAHSSTLNFVKLDGNVGCMVNGAGLAMATMDMIKLSGGEPANFLDVGGTANAQTVEAGFRIILKDPKVKAILINIFGGIVRCDRVAQGVIDAYQSIGNIEIPIIVRLQGTNADVAKKLIDESGLKVQSAILLSEAAALVNKAVA